MNESGLPDSVKKIEASIKPKAFHFAQYWMERSQISILLVSLYFCIVSQHIFSFW